MWENWVQFLGWEDPLEKEMTIHSGMFGLCMYVCVCIYIYVQSPSGVILFMILWIVAHQAPLSMWILQETIWEWVVMPSSKVSTHPMDRTCDLLHCK